MLRDFLSWLDWFTDQYLYLLLGVFALGMVLAVVGSLRMLWDRFMSKPLVLAPLTDDGPDDCGCEDCAEVDAAIKAAVGRHTAPLCFDATCAVCALRDERGQS